MSIFKSCHRCAQPYEECECEIFKGLESAYDQPNQKGFITSDADFNFEAPIDLDSHYKTNKLEPFDVIADMGDLESFCRGNAIKYLMRYKHKGTPVQDLEKAKVYIDKLIELEK
jgi:hypothetical protein